MDRVTQSRIEYTINHLNENVFRFSKTRDDKIVYTLNEGPIPRSLNLQTDAIYGKTVEEVVGAEQAAKVMPLIMQAFHGEVTSYELDMGEYVFQTVLSPIEKEGCINEVSGTSYDITEKRKQEKALKTAHDKLKQANEEKNLLFSILAHDLKSPVGTIDKLLEIIYKKTSIYNDKHLSDLIAECNRSAKSSYMLLENLFDWAKCQLDETYFNPKEIEVKSLIRNVVDLLTSEANEKNIKITYRDITTMNIKADLYYFSTIMRNLIRNAIKFSEPGTEILIQMKENDSETVFFIKDQGIGIEPSRIDKIFNIYQAKSTPGTSGEKGTGLGLSLCKQFITRHGGKIGVSSEVDEGSEFWFSIPKELVLSECN